MDINTILKGSSVILASYLLYVKVSVWNTSIFKKVVYGIFYTLIFTIAFANPTSKIISEPYKSIIIILTSSILLSILTKDKLKITLVSYSIAFAVSYILYIVSAFISTIVFWLFLEIDNVHLWTTLLSSLIQIIFAVLLLKLSIKISLPNKRRIGGFGFVLSGAFIILYSFTRVLVRENGFNAESLMLFLTGLVICLVGIYYFVKKEIVIDYNERISQYNVKRLETELNNTYADMASLQEVHDYLASRVHRDNKLLPAYQKVVETIIENTEDKAVRRGAQHVLWEIRNEQKARSDEISKGMRKLKKLPPTGIMLLDGVFKHMQESATEKDIDFDLIVAGNPIKITNFITQIQLETLTADLVENSIRAFSKSDDSNKNILVYLGISRGKYELSVEDSGVPFTLDTFSKLGQVKTTTHENGSGIGFITIFQIINSCNGSLIITEKPPEANHHTKTITIRFDGKNQKRIVSYRSQQIKSVCDSVDLNIEDYLVTA